MFSATCHSLEPPDPAKGKELDMNIHEGLNFKKPRSGNPLSQMGFWRVAWLSTSSSPLPLGKLTDIVVRRMWRATVGPQDGIGVPSPTCIIHR